MKIIQQMLILIISLTIAISKNLKTKDDSESIDQSTQGARFQFDKTIQLVRDMSDIILKYDTKDKKLEQKQRQAVEQCLSHLSTERGENEKYLSEFFDKCKKISEHPQKDWNNSIFKTTIMTPMEMTKVGSEGLPCSKVFTFKTSSEIGSSKEALDIGNAFNKVFEGFNKMSNINAKPKFITSMAGRNRVLLRNSDFFKELNKASRSDSAKSD